MTIVRRQIEVEGIRLDLLEGGQGDGLIFLHGLAASNAIWQGVLGSFAERWRVVAPDLPGHGRSEKPDVAYTMDFYARIVRELGRVLGLGTAVVVGNSMGGQVAVRLALAEPAFVRALVLVAPAGNWGPLLAPVGWVLERVLPPSVLRWALPRAAERCFANPELAALQARQGLLTQWLAAPDAEAFLRAVSRSLGGVLAEGTAGRLAEVRQLVLLVWGREDRMVPASVAERLLARLPNARLAMIEGAGHLPMIERPDEFCRVLGEFLATVEAAPLAAAQE